MKIRSFFHFLMLGVFVPNGYANDNTIEYNKVVDTPLIVINGYIVKYSEYVKLKPNQIESLIELEEQDAISVFGERGANGAIVVRLIPLYNKYSNPNADVDFGKQTLCVCRKTRVGKHSYIWVFL